MRTPESRAWFGDWEAAALKEHLRSAVLAKVSGAEIGAGFDQEPVSMPALRDAAREWARSNVAGQYRNAAIGLMLEVRRSGIEQAIQHGGAADKLRAFAAIPDILRNGVVVFDGQNPKQPRGRLVVVAGQVEIRGAAFYGSAGFREDVNGRLFYDHELMEIERAERLSSQRGAALSSKHPLPSAHLNDFTARFLGQERRASKVIDENAGVKGGDPEVSGQFQRDQTTASSPLPGVADRFAQMVAAVKRGIGAEGDSDVLGSLDDIRSRAGEMASDLISTARGFNWLNQSVNAPVGCDARVAACRTHSSGSVRGASCAHAALPMPGVRRWPGAWIPPRRSAGQRNNDPRRRFCLSITAALCGVTVTVPSVKVVLMRVSCTRGSRMRASITGSATGMLANYLDRVIFLSPDAIPLPIVLDASDALGTCIDAFRATTMEHFRRMYAE